MPRESFDVYYYQNGRWSLHASYEASEREQAIGDAMGVESKLNLPARVVRETFTDDSTTSEATVTWQGTKGRKVGDPDDMFGTKLAPTKTAPARRPTPVAPPPPAAAAKAKPVAKPAPKSKKVKKKGRSKLTDLAIAILISAVVSVMTAAGIALLTLQLQKTRTIAVFDSTPLIFGSFILVFFITLLIQLNKMFALFAALRSKENAERDASAAANTGGQRRVKKKAATLDNEFDGVVVERGQAEEAPADAQAEQAPEDEAPPSLDADVQTEVVTGEAAAAAEAPAPPPPAAAETAAPAAAAAPAPPPPPPPPPPRAAAKADEEARQVFASFITDAATAVQRDVGEMNAVTKMGFNLYLSGGLSTLGSTKRLSRESQITVLKQGLQAAGNSAERAAAFAVELPSYGKNPRYAGMIQAGAQAMQGHLSGKPQATVSIGPMLSDWSRPEKRPATVGSPGTELEFAL